MHWSWTGLSRSLHIEPAISPNSSACVSISKKEKRKKKVCRFWQFTHCVTSAHLCWFLSDSWTLLPSVYFRTVKNTSSNEPAQRVTRDPRLTELLYSWHCMARRRGGTAVMVWGGHDRLNIDPNHHHCSLYSLNPHPQECKMQNDDALLCSVRSLLHYTFLATAAPSSHLLIDTNYFWSLSKSTVSLFGQANLIYFLPSQLAGWTVSECSKPKTEENTNANVLRDGGRGSDAKAWHFLWAVSKVLSTVGGKRNSSHAIHHSH